MAAGQGNSHPPWPSNTIVAAWPRDERMVPFFWPQGHLLDDLNGRARPSSLQVPLRARLCFSGFLPFCTSLHWCWWLHPSSLVLLFHGEKKTCKFFKSSPRRISKEFAAIASLSTKATVKEIVDEKGARKQGVTCLTLVFQLKNISQKVSIQVNPCRWLHGKILR